MEVVEVCTKPNCRPLALYRPVSPCPIQEKKCTRKYIQPPRVASCAPKKIHRPPTAAFNADTTYHVSYLNTRSHQTRTKSIRPKPIIQIAKDKFDADTTNRLSYLPIWETVKSKPCIPRRRKLTAQGPMQTTTTAREDFGPKYVDKPEIILPSGNIRFCSGQIDGRTTTGVSFVYPGFIKPPANFKPKAKSLQSDEPIADETTHKLSYQPYRVEQRKIYPWAVKPIYKSPDAAMSAQTTYSKSYIKMETPMKAKSIIPKPGVDWFQGPRQFDDKTCYSDAYIPRLTEAKCIPIVPSGNIRLSDKKMASDTTNKLSYLPIVSEKRTPFRPRQGSMMNSGSMQSMTTNKSDYQFKTVEKPEIIIPCDNIKHSNKPIDGVTTSALAYLNYGVVQQPKSFKPSGTYNRSSSKIDGDTVNKLSYQPWTLPTKECYPWAKKSSYERPKERMAGDSVSHMSFAPPGYYIDECETLTDSAAPDCLSAPCLNINCPAK